jgi:hypothetical protein
MKENIKNKLAVKYSFNLDAVKSERIKKKCYYTPLSTYVILNYDNNYITFDDTITGLYRSIIFSYPDKDVVCFSPPKSIELSIFMNKYLLPNKDIWINELIEGVSINLFFDNHIKKWMIATKSSIGGNYWFYGKSKTTLTNQTFLEMFIDALKGDPKEELNDMAILEYLPKEYCYNFILQDPSNNIILPIENSAVYLVSVYKINIIEVEYIPQQEYESWTIFHDLIGVIQFPKHYDVSDYNKLVTTNFSKGYMITNMVTGEKSVLKNNRYEDLKSLLTIKPEIQYHFLCLFRIGSEKIEEYLKFFPKMKKDFKLMRCFLEQFIKGVHKSYLAKYVYKDNEPILEKYKSHIYKIHHRMYLPVLNKRTIARVRYSTVLEYFSKMEPRELMYILNWDARTDNL